MGATEAVRRLLEADDAWGELDATVASPAGELIKEARDRWPESGVEGRRRLIWLLERLKDPAADTVLLEWLADRDQDDALHLLHAANSRRLRLPIEVARRLLGSRDGRLVAAAVAAAGCSGEPDLAPLIAEFLDAEGIRMHAAIALGRLEARNFAPALLKRLPRLKGLDYVGFIVGIELMGDPDVATDLQKVLKNAGDDQVWDLGHALWKLTGIDPVIDGPRDLKSSAKRIRSAWQGKLTKPGEPRIHGLREREPGVVEFVLRDGRGVLTVDYDPPPPASPWPRWDRSLYVAGQPLYRVGSHCGTCETRLVLAGWQPRDAAVAADSLRNVLADVLGASEGLILSLAPLVHALRSGRYLAVLVDLDLQAIKDPGDERSWWRRRGDLRKSEDGEEREDYRHATWPGTQHFQLKEQISSDSNAFGYMLPSQELSNLTRATVDQYTEAIRAGRRPAAVALGWAEEKYIVGEFEERSLVTILLDGHHKTTSYCQLGIPARTIILCRMEDTWGPPDDPGRLFLEMVSNLRR